MQLTDEIDRLRPEISFGFAAVAMGECGYEHLRRIRGAARNPC